MEIKIGDLVVFYISKKIGGSLTAVKYFERIRKRIMGRHGIVVADHGKNMSVIFGNDIIILSKNHIKVI